MCVVHVEHVCSTCTPYVQILNVFEFFLFFILFFSRNVHICIMYDSVKCEIQIVHFYCTVPHVPSV